MDDPDVDVRRVRFACGANIRSRKKLIGDYVGREIDFRNRCVHGVIVQVNRASTVLQILSKRAYRWLTMLIDA